MSTHSVATTQPAVNTVLVRACSWCHKELGTKDGQGISGETSTICPECEAALDDYAPDVYRCYWCGDVLTRHDLRSDGAALPQPLCRACYYMSLAGITRATNEKGDEDAR